MHGDGAAFGAEDVEVHGLDGSLRFWCPAEEAAVLGSFGAVLNRMARNGIPTTGLDLRAACVPFGPGLRFAVHGADLSGSDFSGARLDGATFSRCILDGCRFAGFAFGPSDGRRDAAAGVGGLTGCRARGAVFEECDFSRRTLIGNDFVGAAFRACDFRDVRWRERREPSYAADDPLAGAVVDGCLFGETGYYALSKDERRVPWALAAAR